MQPPEIIRSKTVFQGKVFDVRVDHISTSKAGEARVDVVVHGGAVAILPLDAAGRILFVRQYRHPIGESLLEIPAGTLEPGEEPEVCAIRECQEEIGYEPGELVPLGLIYLAPGYSSEQIHLYLARKLRRKKLEADPEEDLRTEALSPQEVLNLLERDGIRDAKTLVALAKVESFWNPKQAKE